MIYTMAESFMTLDDLPLNLRGSDLEKFVMLYKSWGIDLLVGIEETEEGTFQGIYSVVIEAHTHARLEGYGGFFTKLTFDEHGRFEKQGIWE